MKKMHCPQAICVLHLLPQAITLVVTISVNFLQSACSNSMDSLGVSMPNHGEAFETFLK